LYNNYRSQSLADM